MSMPARACKRLCLTIGVSLAALLAGCGGGGAGGSGATTTGTLGVSLTDAPACGFNAVNVTVDRVRANQSATASETDAGWSEIVLNPARKINLLDLTNGVLDALGQVTLPAGHYTQLRLVLSPNGGQTVANSVVPSATGVEVALDTPSATQSGIKINTSFDVAAGQRTDLILDFDACKSVVPRGNGGFSLMPVITVIPAGLSGITGFIALNQLGNHVLITAQSNGTILRATTPGQASGAFTLAHLTPGNYDVVITADNHVTAVVEGVPVTGATTTLSTANAPFDLPVSATHTVRGAVMLNPAAQSVPAFVAAKQVFGNGLAVTVKSQPADLLTGAYSMTLPVGAPLLNQFGSGTLPIIPIAQPAVAGLYAMQATAAGYQTQAAAVDISLQDAVEDFTLVP